MPRLGVSMDKFVERKAPPADKYGRRIRHLNGVEVASDPWRLFDPILAKVAAGLVIIAAVSLTVALWRLFTFPH